MGVTNAGVEIFGGGGWEEVVAEVLAGPRIILVVSSLTKGISGNFNVFAPKGQIVTDLLSSGVVSWDEGDPRSSACGVCSREWNKGLSGESFDFLHPQRNIGLHKIRCGSLFRVD